MDPLAPDKDLPPEEDPSPDEDPATSEYSLPGDGLVGSEYSLPGEGLVGSEYSLPEEELAYEDYLPEDEDSTEGVHPPGVHALPDEDLPPVHPGEVLYEQYLKPLALSQNRLGLGIGVHPRRINEIVLGKRRVTAETALRLARYFTTTPEYWMILQVEYDLEIARGKLGDRLEREVQVRERGF